MASDTTRTGQTKVDSKAESQLAADPHSNDPAGQHQIKTNLSLSVATARGSAYGANVMKAAVLRWGSVAIFIATTAGAGPASGAAVSGAFPPSIYPSPVHEAGRGLVLPHTRPDGLDRFTPSAARGAALDSANRASSEFPKRTTSAPLIARGGRRCVRCGVVAARPQRHWETKSSTAQSRSTEATLRGDRQVLVRTGARLNVATGDDRAA